MTSAPPDTPVSPPASTSAHWLGVDSGGHRFLVPLAQSGEIAPPAPVLPLPHTQPWVAGVTTLRGDLFTVVDLLRWLGWPPMDPQAPAPAHFMSFSPLLGVLAVWPVQRLLGLRSADGFTPAPEPSPTPVVRQVLADAQGNVWYDLDLMQLCARADFLDIHERAAPAAPASPPKE